MTAANEIHVSFINFKLDFLEKQRDYLHDIYEDANRILTEARAWVQGRGTNSLSFQGICRKIDNMMLFLATKQIGTTSDHEDMPGRMSEEEIICTDGETETIQPEKRPMTTDIYTRHVVASQDFANKIMQRMDTLEASYSCFLAATKKYDVFLAEIQTQIEKIPQTHLMTLKQQQRKIAVLEKQFRRQEKKGLEFFKTEIVAVKQQQTKLLSKLGNVDNRVETNGELMFCLEHKTGTLSTKISDLEAAFEERASTDIDKVLLARLEDAEKRMERNNDKALDLQSRVENLMAEVEVNKIAVSELRFKTEASETTVQGLATQCRENKSLLDALFTRHDEDGQKIKTMSRQMKAISKRVNKNQKDVDSKLEEVNGGYQMVCSIVANRLRPLERLRHILNQKVMAREENERKLEDISEKVAIIMGKLNDTENKLSQRVGFTAAFPVGLTEMPEKGMIIKDFTRLCCNHGNHFDPSTGTFTAPVDGLYVVSLNLYQWDDGIANVNVISRRRNRGQEDPTVKWVCSVGTKMAHTSGNGVGVVRMQAGEYLYVNVVKKEGHFHLTGYSSWTCFLIC